MKTFIYKIVDLKTGSEIYEIYSEQKELLNAENIKELAKIIKERMKREGMSFFAIHTDSLSNDNANMSFSNHSTALIKRVLTEKENKELAEEFFKLKW